MKMVEFYPRISDIANSGNSGFFLVSILVGTAISSILFAAIVSMITMQSRESRFIQQQLSSASLKYSILQTLKNSNNCLCNFDGKTIDTSETDEQEIDLNDGVFKIGCPIPPPVDDSHLKIAEPNKDIGYGLKIESIKAKNIIEITPNEYKGNLIVFYKSDLPRTRSIRPIKINLLFSVDSSGVIKSCGAKSKDNNCYHEIIINAPLAGAGGINPRACLQRGRWYKCPPGYSSVSWWISHQQGDIKYTRNVVCKKRCVSDMPTICSNTTTNSSTTTSCTPSGHHEIIINAPLAGAGGINSRACLQRGRWYKCPPGYSSVSWWISHQQGDIRYTTNVVCKKRCVSDMPDPYCM